ncbi:siderophore-interacting protein [Streptomyces longispororuber]|uniref:siderophore-interacting protein n=1 Tax=Streptomyces longispororuber TaxID=68230 RepID=UPI00210A1A7A|nr:siderophore-interacting protein [Streptomyces longispororuber]MCQ4209178.1 siderophore-interacting protein [Streptomyces longispororuber]
MTQTAEAPAAAPYKMFDFFDLEVVRTRRLGPSLLRVTFTGPALAGFHGGGRDQSLSLFLPHPGQDAPVLPPVEPGDDGRAWHAAYRAIPDHERAVMRSYTLSGQRREPAEEVDIDFVLHNDDPASAGPACRWAEAARPGARVAVLGPAAVDNTAVRCRPQENFDHILMWGDETALPAALGVLSWLPATVSAHVWLEVPHREDVQPVLTAADVTVTWLVRAEGAPSVLDSVRAAELPAATSPYAWLAGESGTLKELRRHLVRERGYDKRAVTFVGYWRRGLSEDALREQPAAA